MATGKFVLELNELEKQFWVEIILHKKVPIAIKVSQTLRKHLEYEEAVIDRESITFYLELIRNKNMRLVELNFLHRKNW